MKNDKAKIVEIINEEILQERLTTYSTEIHREISKLPNLKRLSFWSTASSMVGLYRYEPDGYAYEIEIRPVEIGRHKDLWGNLIKKKEERQNEIAESDKKWIQKAVNPEHKGYCTPMSKPTCTPARKALAKRFKKGIEDESYGTPDPLGSNMAKPLNEIGNE